ncbi:MAG: HIT domain-containing protein [Acidobacteriota bacterium]|jgi:ATP adenylyltransferase|nr:MAG: HIT family hydrolase [Acidobacteriota bacterium]
MERLWTPWRLSYVTSASEPASSSSCIFCDALARGDEPLVAWVGRRAFVILNKFPYNNGHLMVVPKRHVDRLARLDRDELLEIMELSQAAEQALARIYSPHGFNLGINLGRSAGAGIADHLHVHIVPRWDGDTSFMTVFGETRVLPEELPVTAARVREALGQVLGAAPPS